METMSGPTRGEEEGKSMNRAVNEVAQRQMDCRVEAAITCKTKHFRPLPEIPKPPRAHREGG